MADIETFAYVEDEPTKAVLNKIISFVNNGSTNRFCVKQGFPYITRGNGKLKQKAQNFINATKNGCWAIFVTDLDQNESVNTLCQEWFSVPCFRSLPCKMIFRVAVHGVESWIIADRKNISKFFNISETNFPCDTDNLPDPKQLLFSIIRNKCRKKKFRDMLPLGNQHVGIEYNPQLVKFITENWDIEQAMRISPSLTRTVSSLRNKLNTFIAE